MVVVQSEDNKENGEVMEEIKINELMTQVDEIFGKGAAEKVANGEIALRGCLVDSESINLGVRIEDQFEKRTRVAMFEEADFQECPKCGDVEVTFDLEGCSPEGIFVYRVHKCNMCETQWEDRYDLAQVTIKIGE